MPSVCQRRAIPSALFAWLFSIALASCGSKGESAPPAAVPVVLGARDVAVAVVADVGATVTVSGSLDPADEVKVRAQAGGNLRDLRVDRGSQVAKGDVLARIEARGVTSQAEGAKAAVVSAEAGVAVAKQRLDATKMLLDAGATSQIEFKSAQAGYDAAMAQLAVARSQLASTGEAASRTSIISPLDGWVSERRVDEGEAVKSDDHVLTVVDPRMLELTGRIGALDAARVRPGQSVTFAIDAAPGQAFTGTVARVDPVADPATRQVGVYVRLPNADRRVVAGQFARGRIRVGATARSVVVPPLAVRQGPADQYVLVLEGNTVRRRVVTT
ncbi:MAG: efflux RND transporter periplasmic adaptor subunit, partial [Acidobacteriia bacterium]|nr:efflux RND transporter periplasmic adaptor subunit [Terriglobia bacterium]